MIRLVKRTIYGVLICFKLFSQLLQKKQNVKILPPPPKIYIYIYAIIQAGFF